MLPVVWFVSLLPACSPNSGNVPKDPRDTIPYTPGPFTPDPTGCDESEVAFLSEYATPEQLLSEGDDDEASAWLWFHATYPRAQYLYWGDVSASTLSSLHTVFWIRDVESGVTTDVTTLPAVVSDAVPAMREWYRAGGTLLLWGHAVVLSEALGRLPEGTYTASENDPAIDCGKGNNDRGLWIMATQLYPGGKFKKDMSTHPLYRDITIYSDGNFRGIHVAGPGWKENHNCLFFNYPSRVTGRQWQQEICYTLLTDYYGVYPLGVWDSQVHWVSQLNVFELRQGQTDFEGRILCIGNGGCEFSMRNVDGTPDVSACPKNNIYQANILLMARNGIEYLRGNVLWNPAGEPSAEAWVSSSSRQEQYRGQVHYSPMRNWMNDPNGLYYQDGEWHLCYQYNFEGMGCDFDHMCWGHASSPDLMHWTEHTPVMHWDANGAIYSGCTVVDEKNVSGYGQNSVLSFYTIHGGGREQIALAVKPKDSPLYEKKGIVIHSDLGDFRDPNVVWDAQHSRWIMTIARGDAHGVEIWRSTNLTHWDFCGIFTTNNERCKMGAWECPALIEIPVMVNRQSSNGQSKWVLLISTNHNAAVFGSGTMYFVGDFDGTMFVPDHTAYPRFLDYGLDCYASIPFSHTPSDRKVAIGWLNNWDYAPLVPCSPWVSSMTMPRELSLRQVGDCYYLCSALPQEINNLVVKQHEVDSIWTEGNNCDAWLIESTVALTTPARWQISNARGEMYEVCYDAAARRVVCDRSGRSGATNFSNIFAVSSMSCPVQASADSIHVQILVDHSSVEVLSEDGAVAVTNLVFPTEPYHLLHTEGVGSTIVKQLQTIW